jgi:hypothetical protein
MWVELLHTLLGQYEIESSHPQLGAWQAALFITVSSDLASRGG